MFPAGQFSPLLTKKAATEQRDMAERIFESLHSAENALPNTALDTNTNYEIYIKL